MKKIYWISGIIILLIIGGLSIFAIQKHTDSQVATTKTTTSKKKATESKQSSEKKVQTNTAQSSTSSVSNQNSGSNASQPSGEMGEAASQYSSIMSASTGAPITSDMVSEARNQLQEQGINTGSFSDLDIAKVINKANSDSIDYATAIKALYPAFFKN
ncbi:hypothetical protein WOSG25_080270 [Weissella oryzae SG25]|uniref:Uncharacterized protein n=1 Tax=Weissella oryzae (strain DSM 25784 / JCM 18191 / LMG 30913 / SG25) TaxID=1329250 RepID=A0A069CTQ8_WEIOS|nr:hypothetical protein [Weissella oryzae]GAK31195.1 hypothetical protein WOSG25_080270 [Weissella oryzae SG25]